MLSAKCTRHLTPHEQRQREVVWFILKANDAAASWSPELIDLALDYPTSRLAFSAICDEVAARAPAPGVCLDDLLRPNGSLLLTWLRAEASRRLFDPGMREDGVSILYRIVARAAIAFSPCRLASDKWISQGFGAYLRLRSRGLYETTEIACRRCGEFSLELSPDETAIAEHLVREEDPPAASHDPEILMEALRTSLDTAMKWECLCAMAYDGQSLRDYAQVQGIARSTFSRMVAGPIVQAVQQCLSVHQSSGAAIPTLDLGMIARALRTIASEDEFRASVPPVETVGQSLRRPELDRSARSDEPAK